MTETKYTLEQFELDMENASPAKMADILMNAVDNLDVTNPIVKETLEKYKEELMDIKAQIEIEENDKCNKDIESGSLTLYKCIKEYPFGSFNVGQNYYVKVDDIASDLKSKWDSEQIVNIINNMKPITWIYSDEGIGSMKKRTLFVSESGDFSEFFEKA